MVIAAAAVSDYRPAEPSHPSSRRPTAALRLELVRTPDILKSLGDAKGGRFLVGFAAETEDLLANARKKLEAKNLDLIVANDVTAEGAGFGGETNAVVLLRRDGQRRDVPLAIEARAGRPHPRRGDRVAHGGARPDAGVSDRAALVADLLAHARFLEGLDTVGVAWPRAVAARRAPTPEPAPRASARPLRTARQASRPSATTSATASAAAWRAGARRSSSARATPRPS